MEARIFPKELPIAALMPGRDLMHLVVVVPNKPGMLAKIAQHLAEKKINILSGVIVAPPDSERGTLSSFLDITGTNLTQEDVVKLVHELDIVIDVYRSEPFFKGFVMDRFGFPLMASGKRHMVFSVEGFADMCSGIVEVFGSGGRTILFEMGLKAGERKVSRMRELKVGAGALVDIILAERLTDGWCIAEVVEANPAKPLWKVRAQELFECAPYRGRLKEPNSNLFRGYLTGVFRSAFAMKDLLALETSCIAKGDSYCEFTVEPRPQAPSDREG